VYREQRRGWQRVLLFVNFILAGILVSLCMFISLRIEPIQRRVQALPYYAQTYWNKWRPKPDLPPPPAVSAVDTDTLLVARDQVNQLTDAPPQAQAGSGVVPAGQPEVKLAETNLIEVAHAPVVCPRPAR
jgi:hypothetical protein